MIAIGLMSGTSLDGVDAALVKIKNEHFELLKYVTLDYDESFKARLMKNLSDETAKLSEICSLNFELGDKFVKAIDLLLEGSGFGYSDVAFVASHGQTIWHSPKPNKGLVPSTLQIGEASVIAAKTGITVVSDFRTMDVAVGGEGAPLVPMSEFMLFKSDSENIILQNLGGIGNLTYLPKQATIDDVVAFDNGPGNVMIDYFTKKYFKKPYDDGGNIALSGQVIPSVFAELIKDEFITRKPPKSTGRELYNQQFMEELADRLHFSDYAKNDVIATVSEFTVYAMVTNYRLFTPNFDRIVLSGGGSHNNYIRKRLQESVNKPVLTQEDLGLNSDAKEAVAFAVLGYLTLKHRPGNVIGATGAKRPAVLGKITPGKEKQ